MIEITPKSNLRCEVRVPGSKSITNRALVISSLVNGSSILRNPLNCLDTEYMVKALRILGIKINKQNNKWIVNGGTFKATNQEIFIGNSGTCARFLTSLAAIIPGTTKIEGDKNMRCRPIGELSKALLNLNIRTDSNGFLPITVYGDKISGSTTIDCSKSSQFLSSLLMVAPYGEGITINLSKPLVSKPFIEITIDLMKAFGVEVQNYNYQSFIINQQVYRPTDLIVESDLTAASYFFAAPAICHGEVTVKNINLQTKQGDIKFLNILEKMGCEISKTENGITVKNKVKSLRSIDIDMNSMPDVVQTLAVIAIFAKGTTRITNIANLRIKETDRIRATATELRKLGVMVKYGVDYLEITTKRLKPAIIETYNDHRMAMAFSLAGLRIPGVVIKDPGCVSKTFPDFWKIFGGLR